ncbi:TIGR01777 family oxidoreductase [Micrococcoides hystricis]|uniref:TIGR01777 family oxidoreductase n=1 Tax=Micrococcoides hystricis TaxID=1572761 RepID=A0ABV6PBH1_9MICC
MADLQKQTEFDVPAERVRQWLSSPGATQRLTPAYLGKYPGTKDLTWVSEVGVDSLGEGRSVFTDTIRYEPSGFNKAQERQIEVFTELLDYRSRQLAVELEFAQSVAHVEPMVVAMSGSSGMVGTELTALLQTLGHTVRPLVRRPAEDDLEISYNPGSQEIELEKLRECDAVINLAGESIFGRYTERKKQQLSTSRIMPTRLFTKSLETLAEDGKKRVMVSASAVGYYGAHASHGPNPPLLTEEDTWGIDVLAKTCLNWEATGTSDVFRTVNLRLGLVMTPAGGLMGTLMPLVSAGLAGRLGEHLWNSWVSVGDALRAFVFAMVNEDMRGVYNVVSDKPVLNDELITKYSEAMGQSPFMPVPSFAPKLILGAEAADTLALASQRVSNQKIKEAGFRFRMNDLDTLFAHILPSPHPSPLSNVARVVRTIA